MGDSAPLWRKLARRYCDSEAAGPRIAQALAAGDRAAASRGAHTLKGVAATLGLLALRRAAAAVEHELADDGGIAIPDLSMLERAEETARRVIGQHLAS